jgi:hypothetical protein
MSRSAHIVINRELLLVEIERRCLFPDCDKRVSIALSRREARSYEGFECSHCERWNSDCLMERDVPEWWAEISASNQEQLTKKRPNSH